MKRFVRLVEWHDLINQVVSADQCHGISNFGTFCFPDPLVEVHDDVSTYGEQLSFNI